MLPYFTGFRSLQDRVGRISTLVYPQNLAGFITLVYLGSQGSVPLFAGFRARGYLGLLLVLAAGEREEGVTLPQKHQKMCSGCEADSYLRLIDSCITQLKVQGPSRTCNESKEEEDTLVCFLSSPQVSVRKGSHFPRSPESIFGMPRPLLEGGFRERARG